MKWVLGLDIGKELDYSVLVVLQVSEDNTQHLIRHIERYHLGTLFETIYQDVYRVLLGLSISDQHRKPILVVDKTGVGSPVVERLQSIEVNEVRLTQLAEVWGVNITGGLKAKGKNVPKKVLVSVLREAFERGRLKYGKIKNYELLQKELMNFKEKINKATLESYFEGDGEHDDVVMAVALAEYVAWKEFPVIK